MFKKRFLFRCNICLSFRKIVAIPLSWKLADFLQLTFHSLFFKRAGRLFNFLCYIRQIQLTTCCRRRYPTPSQEGHHTPLLWVLIKHFQCSCNTVGYSKWSTRLLTNTNSKTITLLKFVCHAIQQSTVCLKWEQLFSPGTVQIVAEE